MAEDFLGDWQAWRLRREDRLTAPHGYLSITGLHWLAEEPARIAGLPGAWSADDGAVEVALTDGEELELRGSVVTGRTRLGPVDEHGIEVMSGDVLVEVARRGDGVVVRPRDPASPLRSAHLPTPTFAPSPGWVVTGHLRPAADGEQVSVATVLDGVTQVESVAGTVVFEVDGTRCELTAFGEPDGELWILFADATSGVTTYGAGRQLSTPPPAEDGTVVLDFNRAMNLPCAYTSFTTCPFPPPGNRLGVAIEAGEQDPGR